MIPDKASESDKEARAMFPTIPWFISLIRNKLLYIILCVKRVVKILKYRQVIFKDSFVFAILASCSFMKLY